MTKLEDNTNNRTVAPLPSFATDSPSRAAAFLASIVESSEDSIIGSDLNGTILSWNRSAQEMFGYLPEEVAGKNVAMLFPAGRGEDRLKAIEQIKLHEHMARFESTRVRKDGTPLEVSVILSPIRDTSGTLQGVSAIYRNITKQKEIQTELVMAKQAAEAANLAKSEFVANMSHEIRTPMNVLLGMSGLLLDTTLTEEQTDYAQTIRRGAESLLTIINDILDFSKIEAGRVEIDAIDFALEEIIGEVTELMSDQACRKSLELTAELDPEIPALVNTDPVRIRQVLVNLVGNAIKFTQAGEINLSVRREVSGNLNNLRFEVRDSGVGIAPRAQGKVFEAFTQADGSTTRQYGGTGLGLSISKRLVELLGGEIGLVSELGKGSTFWFTVPLVPGATEVADGQDLSGIAGLRVLAVDDNETNRRIIKEQLHSLNIRCELAENAMEAIVQTRDAANFGNPFDLVILDYGMPGMNGVDLAYIIRSDTNLKSTRLLLMTSYAEKKFRDAALAAGIDVVLNKPVRMSDLVRALARATGRAPSRPTPAPIVNLVPAPKCGRLLLVEDNPDNRKLALRFLQKNGYECDVAVNGEEAVAALAEKQYPLVLMDCQMPVMDGFTATAAIRRREGGGRRTPIIAVTAHALAGDRERCLAAGMDDYVSKPLTAQSLLAVVLKWLPREDTQELVITEVSSRKAPATAKPLPPVRILKELEDLVPDFLSNRRNDLLAIARALESNEIDAIRVIGHGMKGSGGGYGFARITEIGAALEQSAKTADVSSIKNLAAVLADYVDRVEIIYV